MLCQGCEVNPAECQSYEQWPTGLEFCLRVYVVLPWKVRCCATLPGFPLGTQFGIARKTAFCCCSRGGSSRPKPSAVLGLQGLAERTDLLLVNSVLHTSREEL